MIGRHGPEIVIVDRHAVVRAPIEINTVLCSCSVLRSLADRFRIAPMNGLRGVSIVERLAGPQFIADLVVFDRETTEPIQLRFVRPIPEQLIAETEKLEDGERWFAAELRELLIEAWTHEIDECIRGRDGRPVHDPHAGER